MPTRRRFGIFGRRSLTASVSVVTKAQREKLGTKATTRWQDAAWGYQRGVPEVQYSARFYGNCLGRCRFYVGKRDSPDEPLTPVPDDDPNQKMLQGTLSRVRGRDGTFSSLARAYGQQQFVAGESYLVGEDGLKGEVWEMLSGQELKKVDGKNRRYEPGDEDGAQISDESIVLRLWQRDPQYSSLATSPMRAVLDICEALVISQAMLTSGDRNRLATNGVWAIPSNAELPHVGDGDDEHLKLLDDLIDAGIATMDDPGSPAAHFPVIVEIDDKYIKSLKDGLITFDREVDKTLVQRIEYLVRRYAQGIDLPPEIVTGKADSNHWTAWAIAQDVISSHVGPLAATLCEDLTSGLIWPTLEAAGMDADTRVQYGVWFDPTDLAVNPDRVADYTLAVDRGAVSLAAYRAVIGAGEDEAPDEAELEWRAKYGFIKASRDATDTSGADTEDQGRNTPPESDGPAPGEDDAEDDKGD